jgi:hypothetical protein
MRLQRSLNKINKREKRGRRRRRIWMYWWAYRKISLLFEDDSLLGYRAM